QVAGVFADVVAVLLAARAAASDLVHEHVRVRERGAELHAASEDEVEAAADLKRGAGARLLVLFAGRDRARGPERTAADPELHVRIDRRLVEHVPASQQADPGRAGLRVRQLAALGLLVAKGGN